jgi:hypothetical protein
MSPSPLVWGFSAETFAVERDLTAWHEAGHAVAHVLTGLSFHDARLWTERDRRRRRWRGRIRLTPEETGSWVPDEQLPAIALAVLAGPETEAQRIRQTSGGDLAEIRAEVEQEQSSAGGDFDGLPELLAAAGITRDHADQAAADMVADWWPQISRIAGILHTQLSMTSAEVKAAMGGAVGGLTGGRLVRVGPEQIGQSHA